MDPNKTLEDLRAELAWLHGETTDTPDPEYVLDLFEALDQWLSQGGFLPADWQGRKS